MFETRVIWYDSFSEKGYHFYNETILTFVLCRSGQCVGKLQIDAKGQILKIINPTGFWKLHNISLICVCRTCGCKNQTIPH